MSTLRLDKLIAARGLAPSRARARDAIRRGHVMVDGELQRRPGATVAENASVSVNDPAIGYVSRAAVKLAAALDHFAFDPADRVAIDLGASTGGFTQVLLERGAHRVFAVDVGHGQLDEAIANDRRVVALEGVNARYLDPESIDEDIGVVVSDVSFISQKLALPPALAMCRRDAFAVVLAKPQFEVGPADIGRGGIVRDEEAGRHAAEALTEWLGGREGWIVDGMIPAPIAGGDGNQEYLIGAHRGAA